MSYNVSITCDGCGDTSPAMRTTKDALAVALKGGWHSVKHLGKHFCKTCYAKHMDATPVPQRKRTKEDFMRERWAARVERLKVVLNLRNKGKTFRECGEAVGVSVERARQMFEEAKRAETRRWQHLAFVENKIPPAKFHLSRRTQMAVNAIAGEGESAENAAVFISRMSESEFRSRPDVPRRVFLEISDWLASHELKFRDND